jgi:hypothetical protein
MKFFFTTDCIKYYTNGKNYGSECPFLDIICPDMNSQGAICKIRPAIGLLSRNGRDFV